jgi:ketosteroid isomerase-like protein
MNPVVEIRSYNLKPGTREHFHELATRDAVPMLRRFKIDVVAHGPSLHDRDSYYLVRAFASVEEREQSEDAFYGSEEWREGPRGAVLAATLSYTTVVVRVDEATLDGLRRTGSGSPSAGAVGDLAALTALNRDYVRSVAMSDAGRFEEILAPDFLCANSDGSLLDRAAFLAHVARPTQISELQAHDVDVRLLGDVAIVHARTTFRHRDGRPGASRYTDVWARRQGRWLAVAAQVTRY